MKKGRLLPLPTLGERVGVRAQAAQAIEGKCCGIPSPRPSPPKRGEGAAVSRRAVLAILLTAPALAQTPDRKTQLETLLNALKAAPTEEAAAALETQLRTLWAEASSPVLRLLLIRATRELNESAPNDAADSFDAALDLDPDLLEGWRGRAQARLRLGDPTGAVRDIQEVLRREPRYFPALQDLSRLAESRNDWRGALAAWQKLLELNPRTPGGQNRLRDLRRRALGEEL